MAWTVPEIDYMAWAKTAPRARFNLARSGVPACPPALLGLRTEDLELTHGAGYGYPPLARALARRYRVTPRQVFPLSGGTSLANFVACAAALADAGPGDEVIVERPTYQPLLAVVHGSGCRVRRLDRGLEQGWALDPDRFERLVTRRTRLAVVTNLHNPSGARAPLSTLSRMAERLRSVGAHLLVDEVYLECLFGRRTESSVHAGRNVLVTNSLTKAYGLDGLRAGWILGPEPLIARAAHLHDALGVNGVAPGEQLTLAALRHLPAIARHAHAVLDPNLAAVGRFLSGETRLRALLPPGGNVCFPRLPPGLDGDRFAAHLLRRHRTLVVSGSFFESPRHVRIGFGGDPQDLERGLARVSRALDELG